MPDSERIYQLPLKILYRDEYLVAVHKPAGLLVHKTNIDRFESRFLLQLLRDQLGQHLYPIHRLDKPCSGLILFAFSAEIAALLQQQMESNSARKQYLLVCRGYCPERGRIDHPLKPIDDFKSKRRKLGLSAIDKPAQEAVTEFQRLATIELDSCVDKYPQSRYSLVRADILSGRKHQIRRHFKHLSHPLIGDPKYGKSKHNNYFAEHLATPRLLLHSWKMSLRHPVSDETLQLCATPDGTFNALLARFDWLTVLDEQESMP